MTSHLVYAAGREHVSHAWVGGRMLMRERKLLAALEEGERSRARLLAIAWADVPEELQGAAAVVMQAHLEKLEAEGRLPDDLRD